MVGIVVVSHSYQLAQEIITFVSEMKKGDFPLLNAGGTSEQQMGSDPLIIKEKIKQAYCDEGVFIFADIGSSILNTQMAIELLDSKYDRAKIVLADAPIVEGTLVAVVANSNNNNSFKIIVEELKQLNNFHKI